MLASLIRPCGPVADEGLAERTRERLADAADEGGWRDLLDAAWPALEPVCGASPYLAGLMRRNPGRLRRILAEAPDARLAAVLAETAEVERAADPASGPARLRWLKAELHLVTALSDLGGAWDLDQVTGALTRFADAALAAALAIAAASEREAGRLRLPADGAGPVPGLFVIAMGKHGAFELNYSSDIDISFFYEPAALPLAEGVEHQAAMVRLTQKVAQVLQDRTEDGYVFRVDLRLRPDPSSTPPAMPVAAALEYYQTAGQNWERAAFIKARAAAGDLALAQAFLDELKPFVWRRNLDFAAIADIHSIKRQIHVHKVDERLDAKGANLKLGRGGIREIEFYVQTQQLILGGRNPALRSSRTLDALAALAEAEAVSPEAREELTGAYHQLRALEHRVQMVADEQTHRLPEADGERRRVAAFWGERDLRRFDARVKAILVGVNRRYGELFAEEEDLSSSFGSLVFTGVDDDPATLATLKRMGFPEPAQVSRIIRLWHHGHAGATRTERGRELFTRLAPRLLEAAHATGAPDVAFKRFAAFFEALKTGVQIQSLFLAQPRLFELVVEVLAFAPTLANTLARRPAALDAMLDSGFFAALEPGEAEAAVRAAVQRADGFEAAMDAARRAHREQAFRLGVQVISGQAGAAEAGPAFADLADGCIRALAPAALAEVERIGGDFPGEVAVVALGKCGSREMTAGSDLDLMTVYSAAPDAESSVKGWSGDMVYGRFTQRLIAALSSQTGEGGLYEVDMRLRPSGTKGPVAVSQKAFGAYYEGEAETWELLALTRARVVWATSDAFAGSVTADIDAALRRPRDPAKVRAEAREMRELMARERPPSGDWDMKLSEGGLVDIEFAAQTVQVACAAEGAPLFPNTGEALHRLCEAGFIPPSEASALSAAWTLQQDLSQVLKIALPEDADPAQEPPGLRRLVARAAKVRDFRSVRTKLARLRAGAHAAYLAVVG